MSRILPNLLDATPTLGAPGPVPPLVYRTDPTAARQRVVNYAAKRLTDMIYVTGLPQAEAGRLFSRRPSAVPGPLAAERPTPEADAEAKHAWDTGDLRFECDDADRRVTVRWASHNLSGAAIARPGYGGILLGTAPAPDFDPAPLSRPSRPDAPWPIGDATAPRPNQALESAADAYLANSPGIYGVMAATSDGILLERYSPHGAPDRPTPSWSMTKAVTATLIARLLQEGWLPGLHDPAPAPLWQDPRDIHRLITLDHLLRMRSGLAYPTLDGTGASDLGFENTAVYTNAEDAFVSAQRAVVATIPGSVYRYNNTGVNVLGAILRDQIERRGLPYPATLYALLADRIGMASYQHSADLHGNMIASGSGFATLRDYARFGLLYAEDGVWNGERLLPEGWADYALTPTHAGTPYAACFRSNSDGTFPNLPRSTAWAAGASDQKIIIFREHRLVVVTTNETDHPIDFPALDRLCVTAVAAAGHRRLAAAAE